MREMAMLLPEATIKGVEPAEENSAAARAAGLDVFTGRLEQFSGNKAAFDLIFSNHVIQHTVDPIDFVAIHANLLADGGFAIVTVQDAREPSNELLFSDQNFSFTPHHLAAVASRAGLSLVDMRIAPDEREGIRFSQMAVLQRDKPGKNANLLPPTPGLDALYDARQRYLLAWSELDTFLTVATESAGRVFNFGAGIFTFILACYCPTYWSRVERCLVDGETGSFFERPVVDPASIDFSSRDRIVLGTRPVVQAGLARRLSKDGGARVVRWDDKIRA